MVYAKTGGDVRLNETVSEIRNGIVTYYCFGVRDARRP